MVRRLNQMSRQCRSKVELIQLGSVHEKYGVWTRPEKTAVIWRRYHWSVPTKLRLRNERRNSILMTRHPDLGSDAKRRQMSAVFSG